MDFAIGSQVEIVYSVAKPKRDMQAKNYLN